MSDTDPTDRLTLALEQALVPVRQELAELDAQIRELEQDLMQKRALRSRAYRVLMVIDPEAPEVQERKHKQKPSSNGSGGARHPVAEQKLEELQEWVREHPEMEFNATELTRSDSFNLMSRAHLNTGLKTLADRGVLRLDRVEGPGQRKVYKLAAGGDDG